MTVIQAADRNRYLAALAEADAGEPEPFLRFIIENVEASLRLMIRAARGESIDEPSDLDKKLALLKKQILSREDVVNKVWNFETQASIYDLLINHWIDYSVEQTNRFDDLFLEKYLAGGVYFNSETGTNKQPVIKEEAELSQVKETIIRGLRKSAVLADVATLSIVWFNFRQRGNSFNVRLLIDFYFRNQEIEIVSIIEEFTGTDYLASDTGNTPPIFQSLYNDSYVTEDIPAYSYQLANKVYDFIAAKLAEADTPPA